MPQKTKNDLLMEKISTFVEEVRSQLSEGQQEEINRDRQISQVIVAGQDDARKCAENAILEAEKFKATVETLQVC